MYHIKLSECAAEDIDKTYEYICENFKSVIVADDLIDTLFQKIDDLEKTPYMWSLVSNEILASYGFRMFQVKNYLLFYFIDEIEATVVIARFIHGSRDWSSILKETQFSVS